jgi:Carboxypeptidase regulatory-like domain
LRSSCIAVGALLLASSALFGQVVEGTVVNSQTGAPIGEASVQIVNAGKTSYQTTSDAQGAFRIEGVADGTYMALVFKTGFQTSGDAAALQRFRVGAGLDPVHLQLKLIPFGKLSGRVFDGTDGPVAGAQVSVFQGIGIGQTVKSDAEGGFSFDGIRPGSYFLSARPPNSLKPPAPVGEDRYGWAKTWFPGVAEVSAAQKFLIRPGAELYGQDIKLRAVPVHSIRGMIRESDGDPAPNLSITLNQPGDLQPIDQHAVSGKDGSFELPDLSDGTWQISAEKTTPSGVILRAQGAATITGRDTDGVELRLNAPFSVPVEFLLATQDSTVKTQGNVLIAPEWGGRAPVGRFDQDGNYKVEGVYPGLYRITPVVSGGTYYLASITLGDRDVLGQPVEFTSGSVPLRVVYRSDGGALRGTVEECGNATIAIAPEDPALQGASFILSRFARCTADGHFEIQHLRPGRYYAFALDQLDQNAPSEFQSILQGLINKAVSVDVTANQTTSVELKVTSATIP